MAVTEMTLNIDSWFITTIVGCGPYGFECDSGQCIFFNLECDGNPDCIDGSDETRCKYIVFT